MKLTEAKICLDCETIFEDGHECPMCAKGPVTYLSIWVAPLTGYQNKRKLEKLRDEAD